jgi:hypothetical protein
LPNQLADSKPYFFDVYYRLGIGIGRENEYMVQPHFVTMKDAVAEHDRICSEGGPADAINFEVSGIRGPKVVQHYVSMSEAQRELAQLRLGGVEEEPF